MERLYYRSRQTASALSSTSNSSRNGDNYSNIGDLQRGVHVITASGQDDRERVYTPPSGIELRGMKKLWQPKT